MPEDVILITGASGEMGRALIDYLGATGSGPTIITLDLHEPDAEVTPQIARAFAGDIRDAGLLAHIFSAYPVSTVYHFAAVLSTAAERNPALAHEVNVDGTFNLLQAIIGQAEKRGRPAKVLFPSSIAVYGVPEAGDKAAIPPLGETEHLAPVTMYGCNKLYCEQVGAYYASRPDAALDFRALRFPGLISAVTVPSGGTSDFAPEMLHSAARGQPYAAFVRPDTTIPFMTMPDAVRALTLLANAPRERLTRSAYNVTAFSQSAAEVAARAGAAFPGARITYEPTHDRQRILDSWPAALDDSAARRDWDWAPLHDADTAFDDYLIPTIRQRIEAAQGGQT